MRSKFARRIKKHTGKLTERFIESIKQNGRYSDSGNLYLEVRADGASKCWILRYTLNGETHDMGLGALHTVSLDEARERAQECRGQLGKGIDPIDARDEELRKLGLAKAQRQTFREVATEWMEQVKRPDVTPPSYRNIELRFKRHIFPHIGDTPIQAFDAGTPNAVQPIKALLDKIWITKPTVGDYAKMDIDSVLMFAQASEYITNGNIAAHKGALSKLLPHKKFRVVRHFPGLPFELIGEFMADLRAIKRFEQAERRSSARDALEFIILTATRMSQGRKAKWNEFDREKGIWLCTEHKTKRETGQDFVVPLSTQALAVLTEMEKLQKAEGRWGKTEWVFPGHLQDRPMSGVTLIAFLHRVMNRQGITIHGFRTTFRTWAEEHDEYHEKDAELALFHKIGDDTRIAYVRGVTIDGAPRIELGRAVITAQRFKQRRVMMQDWADYCDRNEPATVVPFRAAKSS